MYIQMKLFLLLLCSIILFIPFAANAKSLTACTKKTDAQYQDLLVGKQWIDSGTISFGTQKYVAITSFLKNGKFVGNLLLQKNYNVVFDVIKGDWAIKHGHLIEKFNYDSLGMITNESSSDNLICASKNKYKAITLHGDIDVGNLLKQHVKLQQH